MKKSQLLIILSLFAVLFAINQFFTDSSSLRRYLGGLPWYGWPGISLFLLLVGVSFALRDAARARRLLEEPIEKHLDEYQQSVQLSQELLEKYDPAGPGKPYDFAGEYGPAATDVRHRFTLNGTINTKWNFRLSPLVVIQSGPPFDITVGRDLYGATLFNARPGIATDPTKPGLIQTSYGLLDPNPIAGQPLLSRNFGRGPGQLMLNLRVQKIFEFGRGENSGGAATGQPGSGPRTTPAGVFTPAATGGGSPSAGHRYSLTISMSIRNIINHTNPGPIIGNITSPLFGQANQPSDAGGFGFSESANNRRFELQTRLTF
jgi:hypothetical protein